MTMSEEKDAGQEAGLTPPEELPTVISESVIDIAGQKMRCYVLSDGRRSFDAEDMKAFFGPESWDEIFGGSP